ncbi:hypothetical protein SAMN06264346_112110 [Chryseobacterium profundimaris]|uniref:Uncharacterized protein n=2 Tax=Chryseobacterium profundimaris TaxID=1387275 RepID=A0ABY1PB06_9FLAO|nr:hypothetical protein SAMN06264346_112110 [Chryseobacterium profundimaris]
MKFIGFINKHDDYFFAKDLQKYYLADNEENTQRNEVIEYLKKGVLCGAIMSIAEDTDNERMGSVSAYTDGEWYWPEYFVNYLKKYKNFKIDNDFVIHVLKNKDKEVELTEEEVSELENIFFKIAWN